jgi:hypothetical protein
MCFSGNDNKGGSPSEKPKLLVTNLPPLAKGGTLKALRKFGKNTLKAPEISGLGGSNYN